MVVMMAWQHMVFDPAPVLDALIRDNARGPKGCAGRYRRGDFYQRMIPCVAAGLQFSAVSDRAEGQTAARASRPPDRDARACPRSFLFE